MSPPAIGNPEEMSGLTISEKILARASSKGRVSPGDIVDGSVDLLYMH